MVRLGSVSLLLRDVVKSLPVMPYWNSAEDGRERGRIGRQRERDEGESETKEEKRREVSINSSTIHCGLKGRCEGGKSSEALPPSIVFYHRCWEISTETTRCNPAKWKEDDVVEGKRTSWIGIRNEPTF